MPTILITPTDETHWLAMRLDNLNSTDMSALFGMSPYATKFDLWHRKRNRQSVDVEDNERMKWGRRLESAIAHGIGEDRGWTVRPLKDYACDPELRIGASFDFEIIGDPRGPGVLEIKNVDGLQFMRQWSDGEAPAHIEIQLQHQLTVLEPLGYKWGAIAALVGGNTPYILERDYDPAVGAALRSEAAKFWASIDANEPPPPVFPDDAEAVIGMHQFAEPGTLVDLRGNAKAIELARAYDDAAKRGRQAEDDKKSAKAELLEIMGEAEKGMMDGFTISAGVVGPAEIAAYTRAGYRNFRVTAKKAKGA